MVVSRYTGSFIGTIGLLNVGEAELRSRLHQRLTNQLVFHDKEVVMGNDGFA